MTLEELYTIILKRKEEKQKNSYVTSLFAKGKDKILQKVGEEAVEVIIAASSLTDNKEQEKQRLIEELADLFFHIFVVLAAYNISLSDILKELQKRRKKEQ